MSSKVRQLGKNSNLVPTVGLDFFHSKLMKSSRIKFD